MYSYTSYIPESWLFLMQIQIMIVVITIIIMIMITTQTDPATAPIIISLLLPALSTRPHLTLCYLYSMYVVVIYTV